MTHFFHVDVGSREMLFDLVIIGAGPAGSAAAATAARLGRSVALIDKAEFPRDKLCGGGVTERSRAYFTEAFGADLDLTDMISTTQVAFWHDGTQLCEMSDVPPVHLAMRLSFDDQMHARALELGARDFGGQAVADIVGKTVTLADGTEIIGKVLIGADGVNSQVARSLFGQAIDHDTIGFALEVELDRPPTETDVLRIDFNAADWGYGWRFPKAQSVTVGVGGLQAANPDMKAAMSAYCASIGAEDVPKYKGHFLPFGHFRAQPGRGAILLAGDAAGLVDPITGEGIAYAIKSGQLAAQSAHEALLRGKPDRAFSIYRVKLRAIHRNLKIARWLRRLVFSGRFKHAFFDRMGRSGQLRYDYLHVLAGQMEYPQLLIKAARRLPGFALKALLRARP